MYGWLRNAGRNELKRENNEGRKNVRGIKEGEGEKEGRQESEVKGEWDEGREKGRKASLEE